MTSNDEGVDMEGSCDVVSITISHTLNKHAITS
jgi:hypothetical protein